jgi:ankyrin repeat protein
VFVFFSQQLTMGDESNTEALGEFPRLRDKKYFGKDESVALNSLPSGDTLRQHPESVPFLSGEIVPVQGEITQVDGDGMGPTRFQRYFQRIFHTVARGDHKALSNLLDNSLTKVNTTDSQGNTALHHAVASACHKGDWDDGLYQCINVLMSCEQMNVNMPNKKGYTAIGLAVHHLHRTCIEHMLKHPLADRLYLDYCPGDRVYCEGHYSGDLLRTAATATGTFNGEPGII